MSLLQQLRNKIISDTDIGAIAKDWTSNGEQLVFTNGCFDILHQGHIMYLTKARDSGTKLIVGLNTDSSVKRQNKGENRPINNEKARAIALAGLAAVDAVVLFDTDTPLYLIKTITPNVLAKGADYNEEETDPNNKGYIVGSNEVRRSGGQVITIPLEEGFSTTSIIDRISNG